MSFGTSSSINTRGLHRGKKYLDSGAVYSGPQSPEDENGLIRVWSLDDSTSLFWELHETEHNF